MALQRNVASDGLESPVDIAAVVFGGRDGEVRFKQGLDTVNRVVRDETCESRVFPMRSLDSIPAGLLPILIKIDVERCQEQVIAGS
jgi:FkbM family methyltransferase